MRIIKFILLTAAIILSGLTMADGSSQPTPLPANYFKTHEITFGFYNKQQMFIDIKHPPAPIFWTASLKADGGFQFTYLHCFYHTKKYFSADWGLSIANWHMYHLNNTVGSAFISVYLWPIHFKYFNPYIMAEYAGPSLMTQDHINDRYMGGHFIWQDYLGFGAAFGSHNQFDMNVRILHYSNGDIFPTNPGFDVPLVVTLGFKF